MLPKYKLLTILYLCHRFGVYSPPVDTLRHLLGTSYGQTASRLHKERLIDASTKPGSTNFQFSIFNSQLSLTYLGTNALLSHYPLLDYFQNRLPESESARRADSGSLTLVVFNIPEEKRQLRDRLRYVLKSAGFGQINRSLYLSPHLTVKESVQMTNDQMTHSTGSGQANDKGSKLIAFSLPFESFREIDKDTLTNFWDLKEVAELYDEALSRIPDLNPSDQGSLSAGRFLSKFLEAFGQDPFLPPRLLPENWPGRKALEIAKSILTD